MTTSGSTDFSQNRNDIIRAALRKLGNTSVQASDYEDASQVLNMLLKHWSRKGMKLWKQSEASIALTPGTQSYQLGPDSTVPMLRPLEISNVRYADGDSEIPVRLCALQEYLDLPVKSTQGYVTEAHYKPDLTNGTLYVWPTGAAATHTLKFTTKTQIEDMDEAMDDFDCSQEWYLPLVWNLAAEMAPEYGISLQEQAAIQSRADRYLAEAESFDQELTSVFFEPEHY